MRAAWALVRAGFLTASSYRLRTVLSVFSTLATVVPLFFIAGALQPLMGPKIAGEGAQYFAFLVVGTLAFLVQGAAVDGLPRAIQQDTTGGTFEALLATPASAASIFAGLAGATLLRSVIVVSVMLGISALLGAQVAWAHVGQGSIVLLLIIVAHVPIGMLAAALLLGFRTAGPVQSIVALGSGFLGGVYYPTHVMPQWLQSAAALFPLSYGLRALRRTLLDGAPLAASGTDLLALAAFAVGLFLVASLALAASIRYGRRAGSLAHY